MRPPDLSYPLRVQHSSGNRCGKSFDSSRGAREQYVALFVGRQDHRHGLWT